MRRTGIVIDEEYKLHDPGRGHPESPARLESIERQLETTGLTEKMVRVPARPASQEEICLVHDESYFRRVAGTAGHRMMLDPDTVTSEHSFSAALKAVGGLLELVKSVVAGELDNGYALVRPPGHHAERGRAMGFCLFNNVAVAAEHALGQLGLERVAIVDWDLHHGNGTMHSFHDRADVLYVSTHQYPYYPGTGALDDTGSGAGRGRTVNIPLPTGMDDGAFFRIYQQVVVPVLRDFAPQLLLVSTGYDIYRGDPLGGMRVSVEGFGALTGLLLQAAQDCCDGRLVLVLEGGYDLEGLAGGVASACGVLLGSEQPQQFSDQYQLAGDIIEKVVQVQKEYWNI